MTNDLDDILESPRLVNDHLFGNTAEIDWTVLQQIWKMETYLCSMEIIGFGHENQI